jgi:indolepyruvate ferredoxin oxidoreductase alpha subunit
MLGASINYPCAARSPGNRSSAPMSRPTRFRNLASPGVVGGAMIILGEDYGEGASVIQERSYAYALKSSMWLLDPRPDLPSIVRTVEKGFELSEASHAPVMLELRIRACHATGEFAAKNNRKVSFPARQAGGPPRFEYRAACPSARDLRAGALQGRGAPRRRTRLLPSTKLNEVSSGDMLRHRRCRDGRT